MMDQREVQVIMVALEYKGSMDCLASKECLVRAESMDWLDLKDLQAFLEEREKVPHQVFGCLVQALKIWDR